ILLAEVLLGQQVYTRATRRRRFAEQIVPPSVRDKREVTSAELDLFVAGQAQPARSRRHYMETHRILDGGHLHRPRLAELSVGVERAAHPKHEKHPGKPSLTLGNRCSVHPVIVPRRAAQHRQSWMNEQEK